AGGVSLTFPESDGYAYEPGMILSPDGHCRPFAADAAGTVPGAGMGVVLLKPLVNALNDGNRIYATIRGTGVSNDGARKMSFAAPGIDGQAKAVQDALADARLDGSGVDLIEAHGTGTSLGDPVEITALGKAYAGARARPLLIGSVKSNIGHADAAAGVAGLIKATLSLHHRYLPPSLHAAQLNPKLDPGPQRWFDIARHGVTLAASGRPLRAGVSSFGIGGTNAHLILEEAPTRPSPSTVPDDWQVIPLSAAAPGQLPTSAHQLARHLETTPVVLADVATTLQSGRPALKARKALVANTVPTLIQTLSAVTLPPDSKGAGGLRRPARMALLLPGQGAQHAGMGRALLTRSPGFTTHLAEMSERLEPLLHLSLMDALNDPGRDAAFWQDTRIAQPAIVAVSLACAQWWASLGIKTDVMLGHSLGEYTAACLAGVFSTDAVLQIVTERARLMAGMPTGAMLAVALDETGLNTLLLQHSELDLAALNGPRQGVVSGPVDAIEALANDLKQQGIPTQRLRTSHAFHSRAMAPAASALGTFLANQTLNRPTRKFISNLTGTWITPEQAVSPDYWARHMLAPVRFAQGLQTLQEKGAPLIIEAGPGHVLSTLARSQGLTACPTLDPAPAGNTSGETAPAHIQSVARLWESGIDIDWNALTARRGQRIALPGYPWARQVFRPLSTTTAPARPSVPSTPADPMSLTPESDAATLGLSPMHVSDTPCVDTVTKPPEDDWFYTPRWVRHPLTAVTTPSTQPLVLLSHTPALANPVAQALRQWGRTVRVASSAQAVLALPEHERGHLVIVASAAETMPGQVAMTELRTTLLAVRDLILAHHPKPLQVDLLTIGGAIVQGNETACPANTARVAALQVLAVEFPEHHFAGLDLAVSEPLAVAQRLHAWLDTARAGRFLAWRQGQYWTEQVEHCAMPAAQPWPLPKGATVLITGAAGGVGHAFALDIARTSQAPHLLLATHRTPLPAARQRELESLGATVSTLMLDLADEAATTAALTHWQHTVGPIHGVI
ncbi:type I polyketide synthase, partial [Castellaniella sp.]|uniref:type I polyketide synthase n=1 Tax=Castellaniella sp. TaxID=1955812 RepID=UPI00355CEA92